MKALWLIFKLITFPIWLPFWLLGKMGKLLLLVLFVSAASGCVTNTGKLDKSPCACEFTPFVIDHKEASNA